MLNVALQRQINKAEKEIGQPADHLRDVLEVSPKAFVKLGMAMPAMRHQKHASAEAVHLARVVATQMLDCGACLQIAVNLALEDGVGDQLLRLAVNGDWSAMPEDLMAVCHYAAAVAENNPEAPCHAEAVRAHLGKEAQVEIAYALAFVPVFPYLKRALGYAVSCSDVSIEGL